MLESNKQYMCWAGGEINPHSLEPDRIELQVGGRKRPEWCLVPFDYAADRLGSMMPVIVKAVCWHWGAIHFLLFPYLSICRHQAMVGAVPEKSRKRGKDRACFRYEPLQLGYALDADNNRCVITCSVPASMTTQRTYQTFVRLRLNTDNTHVLGKDEGYCLCIGGALGDCTHVAGAMYTMQDMIYAAGRVQGKDSRIKSCTEKLQKWGVPTADFDKNLLLLPMEALYARFGPDVADNKSGASSDTSGSSRSTKSRRRRSTNLAEIEELVKNSCAGKNIDSEALQRHRNNLEEANRIAQMRIKAKDPKRQAKKKD
jgi:hypothetical protein